MIGLMMMLAAVTGADSRCSARVDFIAPTQVVIDTPDMAMKIAEIYLAKFYGADVMKKELPLNVSLEGEVWHLTGKALPKLSLGGVAEITLCRSNGQVLSIMHGD